MKTKHIVSRSKARIKSGMARTSNAADIKVRVFCESASSPLITIDSQYFDAPALRETAALFLKMADVLDAQEAAS